MTACWQNITCKNTRVSIIYHSSRTCMTIEGIAIITLYSYLNTHSIASQWSIILFDIAAPLLRLQNGLLWQRRHDSFEICDYITCKNPFSFTPSRAHCRTQGWILRNQNDSKLVDRHRFVSWILLAVLSNSLTYLKSFRWTHGLIPSLSIMPSLRHQYRLRYSLAEHLRLCKVHGDEISFMNHHFLFSEICANPDWWQALFPLLTVSFRLIFSFFYRSHSSSLSAVSFSFSSLSSTHYFHVKDLSYPDTCKNHHTVDLTFRGERNMNEVFVS